MKLVPEVGNAFVASSTESTVSSRIIHEASRTASEGFRPLRPQSMIAELRPRVERGSNTSSAFPKRLNVVERLLSESYRPALTLILMPNRSRAQLIFLRSSPPLLASVPLLPTSSARRQDFAVGCQMSTPLPPPPKRTVAAIRKPDLPYSSTAPPTNETWKAWSKRKGSAWGKVAYEKVRSSTAEDARVN